MKTDYQCYIGIDPGLTGAMVLLDRQLKVFDYGRMPTIAKTGHPTVKSRIDSLKLQEGLLRSFETAGLSEMSADEVCCFIEDPGIIPTNGIFRVASLRDSYATVHSVLTCLYFKVYEVGAQKWKKQYDIAGGAKNKSKSIQLALRLNPELGTLQISDADIAEALLIGQYGCKYILGVQPQEEK